MVWNKKPFYIRVVQTFSFTDRLIKNILQMLRMSIFSRPATLMEMNAYVSKMEITRFKTLIAARNDFYVGPRPVQVHVGETDYTFNVPGIDSEAFNQDFAAEWGAIEANRLFAKAPRLYHEDIEFLCRYQGLREDWTLGDLNQYDWMLRRIDNYLDWAQMQIEEKMEEIFGDEGGFDENTAKEMATAIEEGTEMNPIDLTTEFN